MKKIMHRDTSCTVIDCNINAHARFENVVFFPFTWRRRQGCFQIVTIWNLFSYSSIFGKLKTDRQSKCKFFDFPKNLVQTGPECKELKTPCLCLHIDGENTTILKQTCPLWLPCKKGTFSVHECVLVHHKMTPPTTGLAWYDSISRVSAVLCVWRCHLSSQCHLHAETMLHFKPACKRSQREREINFIYFVCFWETATHPLFTWRLKELHIVITAIKALPTLSTCTFRKFEMYRSLWCGSRQSRSN